MTSNPHTLQPILELENFRNRLLEMRRNALKNSQKIVAKLQEQEESQEHPEDGSISSDKEGTSQDIQRLEEYGLLQQEQAFLHSIDDALIRIEEGTYGYGSNPEKDAEDLIPLQSLTPCPTAMSNMEAQNLQERTSRLCTPSTPYCRSIGRL